MDLVGDQDEIVFLAQNSASWTISLVREDPAQGVLGIGSG